MKEAELATGVQMLSAAPPFVAYADEYIEWYRHEYPSSFHRAREIMKHLESAFSDLAVDQIEPQRVEQYKRARMATGVKSSTVAKEVRTLKAMLNRAAQWGVVEYHPCPHVKPPAGSDSKPPRWYDSEELAALYASNPARAPIWQLMVNTGLRRGEALHMTPDWDKGDRLHILSEGTRRTKSGRWRKVPINARAREALDTLGGQLPPMNPRSLSRVFRQTAQKAGLDGNLHCLRHTFCAHLVMKGVPLRTVQVLAGHSTYGVTEQYAHLAPEHLADALSGLDL